MNNLYLYEFTEMIKVDFLVNSVLNGVKHTTAISNMRSNRVDFLLRIKD